MTWEQSYVQVYRTMHSHLPSNPIPYTCTMYNTRGYALRQACMHSESAVYMLHRRTLRWLLQRYDRTWC